MIPALRNVLSHYTPSSLLSTESVRASVLVPIFENGTGAHIVLTKRTTMVKYHKGEISFPGGMYEEEDGHSMKTAMRECYEEIGVREDDVEIIGRLDDLKTLTGFVITPYVAVIPHPYDFKLNEEEVHYLIYLPLPYLLQAEILMETAAYGGVTEHIPAIYFEGERIWGATCRLLLTLRKIVVDDKI